MTKYLKQLLRPFSSLYGGIMSIRNSLYDKGVLASESSRAPLRLVFPAALASRWMPGLFPEQTDKD